MRTGLADAIEDVSEHGDDRWDTVSGVVVTHLLGLGDTRLSQSN